jgi:uncharacterized damage-inducible protein DinB
MNTIEYIRKEIAAMHHSVDGSLQNMTDEMFNWPTPGTANTISATLLHLVGSEDFFINYVILGKGKVWKTGNWAGKVGVAETPGIGGDWSEYKRSHVALQPVVDYKNAIWASTDAYLATLTEAELDRKVQFAGGERSVADMLQLAVSHALGHNGEIAAIKGVQGSKGLAI